MKKITTLLSGSDKRVKEHIDLMKSLGKDAQRMMYFKAGQPRYALTQICEDDDEIIIVRKTKGIGLGNNGIYEKEYMKNGITYTKKGRASSRLSVWYGKRWQESTDMINALLKHTGNKTGTAIFNSALIQDQHVHLTKGMLGSIISGAITTEEECAKYCATYSLRGIKINPEYKTSALLSFLKMMHSYYAGADTLRMAYDVNKTLSYFDPITGDIDIATAIILEAKQAHGYRDDLLALNHKIAWGSNIIANGSKEGLYSQIQQKLLKQVSQKTDVLYKLTSLFDKGPVIKEAWTPWNDKSNRALLWGPEEDLPF